MLPSEHQSSGGDTVLSAAAHFDSAVSRFVSDVSRGDAAGLFSGMHGHRAAAQPRLALR